MPTAQVVAAIQERLQVLLYLKSRWNLLRIKDLGALNAELKKADLAPIDIK